MKITIYGWSIRQYGTTPSGGLTLWEGVVAPIACGFIAVAFVYWVNSRILEAL